MIYPKVNSFDLDVEALCDFKSDNKDSINLALSEWEKTNSPVAYWYNTVDRYLDSGSQFYNPDMISFKSPETWTFRNGLPEEEAREMCKTMYRESIAKVSLEILDPKVLQIKKDVRTTFTDQLGVVGKYVVD